MPRWWKQFRRDLAAVAALRLVPAADQQLDFFLSPDQRRLSGTQRLETTDGAAFAQDPPGTLRLGEAGERLRQARRRSRRRSDSGFRGSGEGRSRPGQLYYCQTRGSSVHRETDRAVAELRRAGGDRDGGELKPVFDAILEKAHGLCGADYGALLIYDGGRFWPAAGFGASARVGEAMGAGIPDTHGSFPQLVRGGRLVHIHDMAELAARDPEDSVRRALVELGGIRTQLMVALRKDNALLG